MSYQADHDSALADVTAAGSAATFILGNQGVSDPTTGRTVPSADISVPGFAIEKKGSLTQYQALGLEVAKAKTLFWVPTTYGALPALSSQIAWAGGTYIVKNVAPIAPDGVAIAATIVVSL